MIVDCHTHWSDLYRLPDRHDPSKWLAALDQHGVTHAVVMPLAGLCHAGRIPDDNADVAAACARSGGRMIPLCTVNPYDRREALAELERSLTTLKVRGLKFHPWLQGISPSSPVVDELCEMAGHHEAPVLFHDGTPPFSLPSQIAVLARRHPGTTFILGHLGLFEHWREAIAAMGHAPNLWGCLCGPHPGSLRQLVRHMDQQRLLWGSDHGFTLDDCSGYRLGLMRLASLSDAELENILWRNPRRLLGIAE
jgi:hypothetical protein